MKAIRQKAAKHKGHLLSIDLESWIFSRRIDQKKLSHKELKKLDDNYTPNVLKYLLKVLKKNEQKVTFFIVGKLEEIYPGTIEKILDEGHEVGWHTHTHANIINEDILRKELEGSASIISKYRMKGFQAPTITFIRNGYKLLKKYGFEYSSSVYGNSNVLHRFDGIYEIPVTTSFKKYKPKKSEIFFPANMTISNLKKFGIPTGSSYFWGIFGRRFYQQQLKRAKSKNEIVNMFIHEWQIKKPESEEYNKDVSLLWNPFFYPYKRNLTGMFEFMLSNFKFRRFKDFIQDEKERK